MSAVGPKYAQSIVGATIATSAVEPTSATSAVPCQQYHINSDPNTYGSHVWAPHMWVLLVGPTQICPTCGTQIPSQQNWAPPFLTLYVGPTYGPSSPCTTVEFFYCNTTFLFQSNTKFNYATLRRRGIVILIKKLQYLVCIQINQLPNLQSTISLNLASTYKIIHYVSKI